jgi:Methyltransferase domain
MSVLPIERAWTDFDAQLQACVDQLGPNAVVIEVGAGANPALSAQQVKQSNCRYIAIDIDQQELDKASGSYFERITSDITQQQPELLCDLLISRMVLEHITDPELFHKACFALMRPNAIALHFFATKYSPASLANLVLPENISQFLLKLVQERDWVSEGKFPAYYRWCLGPTAKAKLRIVSFGFKIVHYHGYCGQTYLKNTPLLRHFERGWNALLNSIKSPYLCSNAVLKMQRQGNL